MVLPDTLKNLHGLIGGLQHLSKVPLLIGGNLEEGADVICDGGTCIANNLQIAATRDPALAEQLGAITAAEGTAVGINWAFAPVVDIGMNWRNAVIATRCLGSDPEFVACAGAAAVKGLQAGGMAASLKHFPGDGVDERDQHFSPTVNSLDCETWDRTYGEVYRRGIEAGALTVMVGHIMQPAWSRRLDPSLSDGALLPASTSKELLGGLLRGHLGFNGMISTDSTTMTAFDQLLPRSKAIPTALAAGCDMILFTENMEEDIRSMLDGIADGLVTQERLDEAVLRVLGVKAALGLHREKEQDLFQLSYEEAQGALGRPEFVRTAKDCADRCVTLVKNIGGQLPISPERHRRIYLLTYAEGRGFGSDAKAVADAMKERLEREGFQVTWHGDFPEDPPLWGSHTAMAESYDLILYASNLNSISNNTVCRLNWFPSMGKDAPNYIQEIPTVFVSFGNPYHLADVPRVKTYINAYKFKPDVIDAVVEKLLGRSAFTGISPVDPFCGFWDARL
jgi:beta-N-acetylhexosaminidase